ncbi:MAG: class I SAM-dependent methyltransferase [Nibricoccus sp.]
MPSREELMAAYELMPIDSWDDEAPAHWDWAARCIHELAPNQRVLDVGCFRGDFLVSLPADFERFGIEPNTEAKAVAETRGITIVGREATDSLSDREGFFGAIVLMDVAEHVPDPAGVFRHLRRYLAPGGVLLVLTGNAEHWLPRKSLPFYWYMSFPIHLVYLGERYLRWVAKTDGWAFARYFRFAHKNHGLRKRVSDLAKGSVILLWRRWLMKTPVASLLRRLPPFKRADEMRVPPLLFCAPDHIGVALVKER